MTHCLNPEVEFPDGELDSTDKLYQIIALYNGIGNTNHQMISFDKLQLWTRFVPIDNQYEVRFCSGDSMLSSGLEYFIPRYRFPIEYNHALEELDIKPEKYYSNRNRIIGENLRLLRVIMDRYTRIDKLLK